MSYLYLAIAIAAELIATSCLKASEGFTKPLPTAIVFLCSFATFYFLSLTLKSVPIGIVYATWSGLGIVLITLGGYFFYRQSLNLAAVLGIGLIVMGAVLLNLAEPH